MSDYKLKIDYSPDVRRFNDRDSPEDYLVLKVYGDRILLEIFDTDESRLKEEGAMIELSKDDAEKLAWCLMLLDGKTTKNN